VSGPMFQYFKRNPDYLARVRARYIYNYNNNINIASSKDEMNNSDKKSTSKLELSKNRPR